MNSLRLNSLKSLVLTFLLLMNCGFARAITYYSRASAAWNVNSTWSTVGYGGAAATNFPRAGDIAYIGTGYTITISANVSCASIIINANGVLNPTSTRTVTATTGITINGTYTNQSTGAITTPSWICNGTYNHANSSATLPKGSTTTAWAAASNCNITGSYTSAIQFSNFIGQTFGNFTFNPAAMTRSVCLYGGPSGTVTVQGNFSITQTGSNTLYLRQVGYPYAGTLNINGNFSMDAGIFDIHNGGTTPTTSIVNLKGNFTLSGTSILKQTTVQSGSTVNFNFTGSGVQTVNIASGTSILSQATRPSCAIRFTVASGATIDMGTSILKGTNNTSFALGAGASIITANTGGLSLSGTTGSIQVEGTRTYNSTANYTYNGTSAQVTGNGVTAANNLTISNTNASGATLSNIIAMSGTFSVTAGAKANMGTFISTASSIKLGGVSYNAGLSYGGTGSGANVINTTYFLPATGKLNVNLPPPSNLSYNTPLTFRTNSPITPQNPTVTGIVDSYSINPVLPAGLLFNTTSGAITGTPTVNSTSTAYTITATNSAGSTTCQVVISIGENRYAVANGNWNSTSTWSYASGGASGALVPVSGDIVYIGESATPYTVTIPSGYASECGSLTMGTYSDNTVATLTFTDATSSLTIGNDLVMNRPNASATSVINLNTGSLTVGGTLKLANSDLTPDATSTLINRVNISTGTLTTKNLAFYGQSAPQSQVVFTGAGNLIISGDITFGYLLGTLTPSTGTVNFNGTVAQNIPIGVSAVTYNNLAINNTSLDGATLSNAAITTSNVTGNLTVGNITSGSTFDNGGYAIVLSSGKSLTVANGSTFTLSGTSAMVTAPGGKTFGTTSTVNYSGEAQTVAAETYGNLILSGSGVKTLPSTALTIAGNFSMSGTATATALAAINTTGNFTLGSGTTFNASTFTHKVGKNWSNSGTFIPDVSTIEFDGTGTGEIGTSIFNNITFSGSGTKTAYGELLIAGNASITNNFSAGNYVHSIGGNWTNSGIFTSGYGMIIFNGTGNQTINSGGSNFSGFSVMNTGGTCTASSHITSTGTFNTNTGTILDMATYDLSVDTVSHSGTLLTQSTSATSLTTGKTWDGLVNYNSASAGQTAMSGTYNNLAISSAFGAIASGNITVNGELNLAAANPSDIHGSLEMVTDYNGYPGSTTTNPIVSYILTMGANATTVGQGDVTGKIYRSSVNANTAYSFGNPYTTYAFTVAPSNVTVTVTIGYAYGQSGVWGDPLAVKRSYEMVPVGGTDARVAMNLHFHESELNGNTKSLLVTGDYDIGGGSPLGDEHGRSSYDFTNNYIGLSGVPISYFIYNESGHNWRTVFNLHNFYTGHTIWDGSESSNWMDNNNWSNNAPGELQIAIIPDAANTNNDPVLPAGKTIGGMQILAGGVLNLDGQTITIKGYNYNGWEDQSGLSNYTGSTVILDYNATTPTPVAISGVPHFNNLTITASTNVTVNLNSHVYISGNFTKTGNFDAGTFENTVEYNGESQTVVLPDGDNKYYNLMLSGSGPKTMPANLTVYNDFTLSGSASIASGSTSLTVQGSNVINNSSGSFGGTVNMSGTSQQTIAGTLPATFNSLTINNPNGVLLGNDETVNGTLTLTSGVISTDAYTMTAGCDATITGAGNSSYIDGKLSRIYCSAGSKSFPVGKGGNYYPMALAYTALTGTSTVTSEVFGSVAINGTLPPYTSLLSPNRYWSVSQTGGSAYTYDITLDGTGYTFPGTAKILKDGSSPLNSYATVVNGNNYTSSGLTSFSNFELGSECEIQGTLTGNDICTGGTGQLQWTATTGSGPFTIVYFDGNDNRTATGVESGTFFNVYLNPTVTTNYTLVSVGNSSCTQTSGFTGGTATIDVIPSVTWNGIVNNDWHTAANWTPAHVPLSCSDVIIPASAPNFPTISSPVSCNNLTLESGTSILGEANLTVGGTAVVERYIANDFKWHFLSSPVPNQAIWPEFAPSPDYSDGWNPISDQSRDFNWDFYYFNPYCPVAGLYWVNMYYQTGDQKGTYNNRTINDPSSLAGFGATTPPRFIAGKGYLTAYYAGWNTAGSRLSNNPAIHSFSGTSLNTGTISPVITNATATGGSSYNLVGNPYHSSIDWKSSGWGSGRNDLADNSGYDYWIWNGTSGTYGVFNSNDVDAFGTNGVNQYIAPEQAFFVRANSVTGSLSMNNDIRTHSTQTWLKEREAAINHIRLKITTEKNNFSDEMIFAVHSSYQNNGSNKFWSMYKLAPEIWSVKNGHNYSIDRMPTLDESTVVNIGVKPGSDANYTLTANGVSEFYYAKSVILEDLKTGFTQELKINPVYGFSASPDDSPARFRLHFNGPFGINNTETIKPFTIYSYMNTIYVQNNSELTSNWDLYVCNIIGQTIFHQTIEQQSYKTEMNIPAGAYIVTIISRNVTTSKKIIIRKQ